MVGRKSNKSIAVIPSAVGSARLLLCARSRRFWREWAERASRACLPKGARDLAVLELGDQFFRLRLFTTLKRFHCYCIPPASMLLSAFISANQRRILFFQLWSTAYPRRRC